MRDHRFEFIPIGQQWGWTIADGGQPSMWWTARLSKNGPKVCLSDGRDARELEACVEVRVRDGKTDHEAQHECGVKPVEKQGCITTIGDKWRAMSMGTDSLIAASDKLWVVLYRVLPINFDRVLGSIQRAGPPNLTVSFGPESTYGPEPKGLAGPITMDSSGGYQWNDTDVSGKVIDIQEWELTQSQSLEPPDAPETEEVSGLVRGFGVTFAVVMNVVTIAIAIAAYQAMNTKFQVISVSLLTLIYVAIANSSFTLGKTLARAELSAISRYLELRTIIGIPTRPNEAEYLSNAHTKLDKPSGTFWVNISGITILGLMAIYNLIAVLW